MHSQSYIHWTSNHFRDCKLGILKGRIYWAHLLCDRKEDLLEEINSTVTVKRCLYSKFAEKLKKAEQLDTHQEEEMNEEYYDVLYAPYMAGLSARVQKDFRLDWLVKLGQLCSHEYVK